MRQRLGAYSVIQDDVSNLLLVRWTEGHRRAWTLPGGGVEWGESPADAARREALEETGYRVRVGALLGVHSRVIPAEERIYDDGDGDLHTLRILYRAHVTGGRLQSEQNGTTDGARWFPLDALPPHRVQLVDHAIQLTEPG